MCQPNNACKNKQLYSNLIGSKIVVCCGNWVKKKKANMCARNYTHILARKEEDLNTQWRRLIILTYKNCNFFEYMQLINLVTFHEFVPRGWCHLVLNVSFISNNKGTYSTCLACYPPYSNKKEWSWYYWKVNDLLRQTMKVHIISTNNWHPSNICMCL